MRQADRHQALGVLKKDGDKLLRKKNIKLSWKFKSLNETD